MKIRVWRGGFSWEYVVRAIRATTEKPVVFENIPAKDDLSAVMEVRGGDISTLRLVRGLDLRAAVEPE